MMNQTKKARLEDNLRSEQEGEETDAVEKVDELDTTKMEEEVEDEMTSKSLVLETDRFPHILGRIFSHLDPPSVKSADLVSR